MLEIFILAKIPKYGNSKDLRSQISCLFPAITRSIIQEIKLNAPYHEKINS